MPITNCLLIANHINDLATSLIAQLIGADYQVIMLVEDANGPAYANPLPSLHVYQVSKLERQTVEKQMHELHSLHGELQHLLFCSSAGGRHVSGKDVERGRFWTSCFSNYHEHGSGNGSMMLLHKNANQHTSNQAMNLLPGLSRWWAKQHPLTGLRSNSLSLQGYNHGQLHMQTGSLIKRLMQQQDNGCHFQLTKDDVSVSRVPTSRAHSLSLL